MQSDLSFHNLKLFIRGEILGVDLDEKIMYNFKGIYLACSDMDGQFDHTKRTIAYNFIVEDMEFLDGLEILFLLNFYHLVNNPKIMINISIKLVPSFFVTIFLVL